MQITAHVRISNATFEEWAAFFESYYEDRVKYIKSETVIKVSNNSAEVKFEVSDLDGLTALSSREDILAREAELGVSIHLV